MSPEEKEEFYKYAAYYNISDFADLSIPEVVALEFLARYPNPIVRHTLYAEVNQFLEYREEIDPIKGLERESDHQKKFYEYIEEKNQNTKTENHLSSSTFYNSLSNFEKMGLLKFNRNESGKVAIEATQFTRYVPRLLLKFLINNHMNQRDDQERQIEHLTELIKNQGKERFESILSVWFSEFIVFSIVSQMSEYTDELFILSKNQSNFDKNKLKIDNLNYSRIHKHQIREPENAFDAVLIPVYKRNPKFYGIPRDKILNEIVRVTKPEGIIGLVAMSDVPLTNNPIADELIKLYQLSLNNRIFTEKELINDLTLAGISDIKVIEYEGFLIGIGRK